MVQTRKGTVVDAAATIAYQKVLGSQQKAQRKKDHATVSAPKLKSQKKQAANLSRVLKKSSRIRKVSSKAKPRNVRTATRTMVVAKIKQEKSGNIRLGSLQVQTLKRKRAETEDLEDVKVKNRKLFKVFKTGKTSLKITFAADVQIKHNEEEIGNKCQMVFGQSPYVFDQNATPGKLEDIYRVLRDHHAKDRDKIILNPDSDFRRPGYACTKDYNVFHGLVEMLMSGATSNENQKLGADQLFRKLTYTNGVKSDICPNYHKAISMSCQELAAIMYSSGKQQINAKFLVAILQDVYNINTQRYGEDAARIHEEALNSDDWRPGLLSLDFLAQMEKQELFNKLTSWKGIGLKIAACIMCYIFQWPVFIMDTHNFRILKWMNCVPRNSKRDEAGRYIDSVCPDLLKDPVHQSLWHHGRSCDKCSSRIKENSKKWKECVCPLEQLGITRFQIQPEEKSGKKKNSIKDAKTISTEPGIITRTLKGQEERDSAVRVGLEIFQYAVDDLWGLKDKRANIKKEPAYYIQCTKDELVAWKMNLKKSREARKPKPTARKEKRPKIKTTASTTTTTRTIRRKLVMDLVEEEVAEEEIDAAEEEEEEEEEGEATESDA